LLETLSIPICPDGRIAAGSELGLRVLIATFAAPIEKGKNLEMKNVTNTGCPEIGSVLAIHPDGRIVVCCGHITSTDSIEMLTVGNVKEDRLEDVIKRMQRNVLYWWIFLKGPVDILNTLCQEGKVYHKCEACYLLDTKYKENLRKLSTQREEIFKMLIEECGTYGIQDYLLGLVKE
jgi:MoaA/NifB/PqqE/SkfB family radical SAM enzyme